ncbi:putative methyltransferase-like protein 24 [Tubulanus polymorphus]|uniref:putative methyltransferase-like protein 24 n=1 Tax=Tubulanus polymorphus TaxID=672921 RepID=UPI003DA2160F
MKQPWIFIFIALAVLILGKGFIQRFFQKEERQKISAPIIMKQEPVYPTDYLELFKLYHSKILHKDFTCQQMRRFGNAGDGGWDMCLDVPYNLRKGNCLVYSFGIDNDFTFDDSVATEFNCEIHSFDPSMHQQDHKRGNYIQFHNLGVSGTDFTNNNGWKLMTVDSIMKSLGHENRIIDFFKIDVEYSEWDTFEQMIKAGTFNRVKQIGVEYHIHNANQGNKEYEAKHKNEIRRHLTIFDNLEAYGFKIYHFHTNIVANPYVSSLTGKNERCCQEIYYVNTKISE